MTRFSPSWWLNVLGANKRHSPRPAPPEHRIYAIGDIHGRLDLLETLCQRLVTHAEGAQAEVIFLGDYIDRGPDSAGVVAHLLANPFPDTMRCTFLKGNHEATLLDFLRNPMSGAAWVQYGGAETLLSYGVRAPQQGRLDEQGWAQMSADLARSLPADHLAFYEGLQLYAERGCYFFAHAGVDPDKGLDQQDEAGLLWVRDAFLEDTRRLSHIIVHGHTPAPQPYADERRIGLDTGAYQTGVLTAACLDAGKVSFVRT
ncbi:MAG: metallophosphoesterase family protein [Oceanicaulis sp.]